MYMLYKRTNSDIFIGYFIDHITLGMFSFTQFLFVKIVYTIKSRLKLIGLGVVYHSIKTLSLQTNYLRKL